jgi:hypothetical protein
VANGLEKKVDRLGTLLEEVAGHVRVLAEGHGAVVDRLDRLDHKVDGLADHLTATTCASSASSRISA